MLYCMAHLEALLETADLFVTDTLSNLSEYVLANGKSYKQLINFCSKISLVALISNILKIFVIDYGSPIAAWGLRYAYPVPLHLL